MPSKSKLPSTSGDSSDADTAMLWSCRSACAPWGRGIRRRSHRGVLGRARGHSGEIERDGLGDRPRVGAHAVERLVAVLLAACSSPFPPIDHQVREREPGLRVVLQFGGRGVVADELAMRDRRAPRSGRPRPHRPAVEGEVIGRFALSAIFAT